MYKEMMDTIGLVNTVDPELGAATPSVHVHRTSSLATLLSRACTNSVLRLRRTQSSTFS